jgi:transposase
LVEQLLARAVELEQRVATFETQVSSQAAEIARLLDVVATQEAELAALRARGGGPKNSQNSSLPPSHSFKPNRPQDPAPTKKRGARKGHRGVSRFRSHPDQVVPCHPQACRECGRDLTGVEGHERGRSQQVELPQVAPVVTELVRYRCTCPDCGEKTTAPYPDGWDPRQTFGPRLQLLLAYLHHCQHVSYARLCRMLRDLWGISISEGALANSLARTAALLEPTYAALRAEVCASAVVGSDETPQRVDGKNHWGWVVQSATAAYHFIAASRAARELAQVYGECVPEVQECDLYSGQLASPVATKAVCHAHQLRDLRYAEEHGDRGYAPKMSRLIRIAIGLWHRRDRLAPSLFTHQAARIKRLAHQLGWGKRTPNPFGEPLQRRFRRHEAGWWVFLDRPDVSPTNNASERALREAVVHRKVLGGFRSDWGAHAYAAFLSIAQTAQKRGLDLLDVLAEILLPTSPVALIPQPDR